MQGVYLKVFVPEKLRNHGNLFYEWIFREAESSHTIAEFGCYGHLQEQNFLN